MEPEKLEAIRLIAPVIGIVGVAGMIGWMVTTWLRIKNGYPLDGAWGQAVYPKAVGEDPQVTALVQENAQLRAELGALKERLVTVERIVTDGNHGLTSQIEALREPAPRIAAARSTEQVL